MDDLDILLATAVHPMTLSLDQPAASPTRALPELLAPAGNWDAMRAAVANGADAVYFGLENFNARHRATNFAVAELPQIIRFLHDHNVKGFVTFNTLIFSDELPAAAEYVAAIAAAGADAVIVQDLGLARLIHAMAPSLAIHGSTQMTLTEPRGIEFVRRLGVVRVVLARELGVEDIRKIAAATDMPLEVFIHGALCVAYSGQCLTSEALGGRSANRGQCAQACRLPYELIVDGVHRELGERAYLLSPQDLAGHELVADLAELNVASLKIEGRLKSAHYVAATAATYRQALDAAGGAEPFRITPQQRADLEQTFSRGFTHGFLSGVNHQQLVAGRFPKSRGRRLGTVQRVGRRGIVIRLDGSGGDVAMLAPGDGVVFDEGHPDQDEQGGRVFAARALGGGVVEIELGRGDVDAGAVAVGAIVWKTDDPAMRRRLEQSFSRVAVVRRAPLEAVVRAHVGEPLAVTLDDGASRVTVQAEGALQPASKLPFTPAAAREQLGRLGDTPYALATLSLDVRGEPMVPKSVLNDLRRRGVERLLVARAVAAVHRVVQPDALRRLRDRAAARQPVPVAQLSMLVRNLDQLDGVLGLAEVCRPAMVYCDFEDVRRYRDAVSCCNAAGMPIALATLRIIKPGEEGLLRQVGEAQPGAVLVRSLAAISFFAEQFPHLPMIGDYSLNVANELTADILLEAGVQRLVPSYDLNWRQMAAMLSRADTGRFEVVVHQHMPMFHMEHCVFAHTLSSGKDYRDCGRPCERHAVDLRDHAGQRHPLIPDVGCRNTVYNAAAQSAAEFIPEMLKLGLRHFRIELLRESAAEVGPLVDGYLRVLRGQSSGRAAVRSLRVLNQLGVTRGTLDRE